MEINSEDSLDLTDYEHDYVGTEGSTQEYRQDFNSWRDFMMAWGDALSRYNVVYRWDILDDDVGWRIDIFIVMQRKGLLVSTRTKIRKSDMPSITRYLEAKWGYMKDIWSPLPQPATIEYH
jgi:hypothetical protein